MLPERSASSAASPAWPEGPSASRAVVAPLLLEASPVVASEVAAAAPAAALAAAVVRVEARPVVRAALVPAPAAPVAAPHEATEPTV